MKRSFRSTAWCLIVLAGMERAHGQDVLEAIFPGIIAKEKAILFTDDLTRASATVQYRYDDLYREQRGDLRSTVGRSLSFGHVAVPLGPHSRLDLLLEQQRTWASYDRSRSDHARFSSEYQVVTIRYQHDILDWVRGVLTAGHRSDLAGGFERLEAGIMLRRGNAALSLQAGSSEATQIVELNAAGVAGILPLDFRREGGEVAFSVSSSPFLFLLKTHRARLITAPGLAREGRQFVPVGMDEGFEAQIETAESGRFSGKIDVAWQSVRGVGKFIARTSPYGAVNELRFERSFLRTGMRFKQSDRLLWNGELGVHRLRGAIRGYAESWPFVSLFDMPVAQREYIEAGGSLNVYHAEIRCEGSWGSQGRSFLGARVFRLVPDYILTSWETRFLGFGKRGIKERESPFASIDGLLISAGVERDFSLCRIKYTVAQVVPLQIQKNPSRLDVGGGMTSSVSVHVNGRGGQFHTFTLSREF